MENGIENRRLIGRWSRFFQNYLRRQPGNTADAVALIPVQLDRATIASIAAVESIYSDFVNHSGYCIKGDDTGLDNTRIYVVVLRNGYQIIDCCARVDCERGVVVTSGRIDSDTGANRRLPLIPDRMSATTAIR